MITAAEARGDVDGIVTVIPDTGHRYVTTKLFEPDHEIDVPDREHRLDDHSKEVLAEHQDDWHVVERVGGERTTTTRRERRGMSNGGDPPADADERDRSEETAAVGGVLLAAGRSTRFEGGNKLLAEVDGVPVVRRAAETLCRSAVDEVAVVVGHEAGRVEAALDGLDVSVLRNESYDEGQSTSVGTGVEVARRDGWDAVVFALGDMPFVRPGTVDALRTAYEAGDGTIAAAAYEGKRGNPVLFGAEHYDALSAVTGDRGGRRLIEEHEDAALVETDDPGVVSDVDDEADLDRYAE
jgi:molybdenum cofactor cytidylyltransferase